MEKQKDTNSKLTNIIARAWDFFVAPNAAISDPSELRYVRLASTFLISINILNFIGFLAGGAALGFKELLREQAFTLISAFLAYIFSRTKYYKASVFIFSLTFGLSAYTSIVSGGPNSNVLSLIFSFIPISLVVASVYLSWQLMTVLTVIDIAAIFILPTFGIPLPENYGGIAGILLTLGFVLIIFTNFRNNAEKDRLEEVQSINRELKSLSAELENRVEERTARLEESTKQIQKRASQLEAIANTARSAATIQNLKQLLPAITRDISKRFGFYHIGIFLLDSNKEYAILSAANSDGGLDMLARGHRLKVGEQGLVGYATSSGKPRIALDVGEDAIFFNNPDLPDTHSEVALPLKFGKDIIGALDIQSTGTNAFSQDDVEIFSILADQVSVAIQNTRSLEQTKQALHEAEISSRQATAQAWEGFSETIRTKGYRYDGIKPEPLKASPKSKDEKGTLSVPVQLRGNTIGRLKLRPADQSRKWTEDELAIIESTTERVAIALESARLLEDAQKRASRETFLSEMAAKLGASFQLDSILRDTVEELGQTLKGSKVTFQLVNPSSPPAEDNSNGKSTRGNKSE